MTESAHLWGSFEKGDALFKNISGGVLKAGVDVAEFFEGEKVGRVFGAVELEGGGAINRDSTGICGGIGFVTAVDADGFEFHNGG